MCSFPLKPSFPLQLAVIIVLCFRFLSGIGVGFKSHIQVLEHLTFLRNNSLTTDGMNKCVSYRFWRIFSLPLKREEKKYTYICLCHIYDSEKELGSFCPPPYSVSPCACTYEERILEWVAMASSRGTSWPRDETCISYVSCIGRQVLYH